MQRGEFLPARFVEHRDKIDDMVGALHGPLHRPRHAHIGLHSADLADIAERLQVTREVGPPAADPHLVAALCERPHDMTSQKAGAAENGHELRGLQNFGHGGLRRFRRVLIGFSAKAKSADQGAAETEKPAKKAVAGLLEMTGRTALAIRVRIPCRSWRRPNVGCRRG
jgi:hypothetical protein